MPDLALANAGVLKQLLLQTALNSTGRVAVQSPYNRTTLATVITGAASTSKTRWLRHINCSSDAPPGTIIAHPVVCKYRSAIKPKGFSVDFGRPIEQQIR